MCFPTTGRFGPDHTTLTVQTPERAWCIEQSSINLRMAARSLMASGNPTAEATQSEIGGCPNKHPEIFSEGAPIFFHFFSQPRMGLPRRQSTRPGEDPRKGASTGTPRAADSPRPEHPAVGDGTVRVDAGLCRQCPLRCAARVILAAGGPADSRVNR